MSGSPHLFFPADVPEAQALVRRLCELQRDVVAVRFDSDMAADCFCGESGFWPLKSPRAFRNEGHAVEFIERATRLAMRERRL